MAKDNMIRHTHWNADRFDISGKLVEVIEKLQAKLKEIPEEYRPTAEIDVDTEEYEYDTGCFVQVTISYERPMTAEEIIINDEEIRQDKERRRTWELYQLEQLKKKYEK